MTAPLAVVPAKAGTQTHSGFLDSRVRGNDIGGSYFVHDPNVTAGITFRIYFRIIGGLHERMVYGKAGPAGAESGLAIRRTAGAGGSTGYRRNQRGRGG